MKRRLNRREIKRRPASDPVDTTALLRRLRDLEAENEKLRTEMAHLDEVAR